MRYVCLFCKLQKRCSMTYNLKKNATKEDVARILKKIASKKKGIDMKQFAGKIKTFDKITNVVEWQRRQRDDGTYNY